MTRQQEKILETVIYFLERYKKAVTKSDQATGFEDLVFDQMIDTVKELQEENDRLPQKCYPLSPLSHGSLLLSIFFAYVN